MEHFEETALEGVTHKPLCWFFHVNDIFIIRPHGPGKLLEFSDHLNSTNRNIQFATQIKRDGHPTFLDINIYHKPDGSLQHKVYHKPTYTHTLTSTSTPTLTTTLPTERIYTPHTSAQDQIPLWPGQLA
jgi:hypothetical protein